MEKNFRHENHRWPPALAHNGNMRGSENKSDILLKLEPLASKVDDVLGVEMKAIDGSALTHSLDPKIFKGEKLKDFAEYAEKLFLPNILQKLEGCQRCDIIFDVYKADSLKHNTRVARGPGDRLKIDSNTHLPKDWHSFLRVDSNKTNLYSFLADKIKSVSIPEGKVLVSTKEENVLVNRNNTFNTEGVDPSNQEEGDTRLLLHIKHAYDQGFRKLVVVANDSDVVVICISLYAQLADSELWVDFGSGKHRRYIAIHEIASQLGVDRSSALLFLHSFSGCDTVSSFCNIGKKNCVRYMGSVSRDNVVIYRTC